MRFILGLIWKYQKFQISWLKNLLNLVRTMQQWMKQKRGKIKAEWLFCVLQAFIFPLNTTKLALVLTIMHISTENQPHFVICNIKHYSYYTTAMINHRLKSATVSFYFEKFNPYWMVLKQINITYFSLHDRLWLYWALHPVREPTLCGRSLSLSIRQRSPWREEINRQMKFFKCDINFTMGVLSFKIFNFSYWNEF